MVGLFESFFILVHERLQEPPGLAESARACHSSSSHGNGRPGIPIRGVAKPNHSGSYVNSGEYRGGKEARQRAKLCPIPWLQPQLCVRAGISRHVGARHRRDSRSRSESPTRGSSRGNTNASRTPQENQPETNDPRVRTSPPV